MAIDLSGLTVGDYWETNGNTFIYAGITPLTTQNVVLIDNRHFGGSELPQAVAAGSLTVDPGTRTMLPIDPTAGDLTITMPSDGRSRIFWNIGTTNNILLPDGAKVRPGEKYQVDLDPVGSWISSPIYSTTSVVIGSGSVLPAAADWDLGNLFLLYNQGVESYNGWYEVTGTPIKTWTQRLSMLSGGGGVGIGEYLPALSATYSGPRVFVLHSQAVNSSNGVYSPNATLTSWIQRTSSGSLTLANNTGLGVGIGSSLPPVGPGYSGPAVFLLHSQSPESSNGVYELNATKDSWVERLA